MLSRLAKEWGRAGGQADERRRSCLLGAEPPKRNCPDSDRPALTRRNTPKRQHPCLSYSLQPGICALHQQRSTLHVCPCNAYAQALQATCTLVKPPAPTPLGETHLRPLLQRQHPQLEGAHRLILEVGGVVEGLPQRRRVCTPGIGRARGGGQGARRPGRWVGPPLRRVEQQETPAADSFQRPSSAARPEFLPTVGCAAPHLR